MQLATCPCSAQVKAAAEERGPASIPELSLPSAFGLEASFGGSQKESVEWVNMVLHKIWKVYRRSLEAWLVGLLQPAIDSLELPSAVRRVEIAEFSLDYEPLSVRNVQRRASRRANDLQYVTLLFSNLSVSWSFGSWSMNDALRPP